jgi:hypothetical protein
LNLILGLVAALIAAAVAKTWVSPAALVPSSTTAMTSQDTEVLTYNPIARPPLAQFDVLLEKNPFKQPPPMPVTPSRSAQPQPLPALVGTILVDSDRRAILSDKGKANIYVAGQTVAGGVITEIKEDRILLKRGDETLEIILKAAIKSAPPAAHEASSPSPPVPVPPPGRAAFERVDVEQSVSPIDRQEPERWRQERRRTREERRLESQESKDR